MSDVNAVNLRWSLDGSVSTSQIPRTLLIKQQYNWSMSPNCVNTAYLWIPKKIVTQGGAGGGTIAVTIFCNQYVSPNWKKLFVMRSINASINTAGGTDRCFSFLRANRPMWWSTGHVWIFVYMEVSSQINRQAFDGIFVCRVPFLMWTNTENIISAFEQGVAAIMWWSDPKDAGDFRSMTWPGVSSAEPY